MGEMNVWEWEAWSKRRIAELTALYSDGRFILTEHEETLLASGLAKIRLREERNKMDCGAWVNAENRKIPYVVRIRGCEFGLTGEQLSELTRHINAINEGAKESISEELADSRIARKAEGQDKRGTRLLKLLGIDKKAPEMVMRRL
jgi:hypothetical protein